MVTAFLALGSGEAVWGQCPQNEESCMPTCSQCVPPPANITTCCQVCGGCAHISVHRKTATIYTAEEGTVLKCEKGTVLSKVFPSPLSGESTAYWTCKKTQKPGPAPAVTSPAPEEKKR